MLNWANDPFFEVLVDKLPDHKNLRYTNKDSIWYAESEDYVSFYAWLGPGNERGFGGSEIPITLVDGQEVILLGPWSSRSGAVNSIGFGPCLDVSITNDPKVFDRGHTFLGGHVTKKIIERALPQFLPGVILYKELRGVEEFGNDITYMPCLKGMTPKESKIYLEKL